MADDILRKRFIELAARSYNNGIYTFTDFLGLAEQSELAALTRELSYAGLTLFGGVEGAERVMARFGSEDELGYIEPFPIVCVKLSPKSQKFSEDLTHRDYLGALMNLGIERDTLGDIAVIDKSAYVFMKEGILAHVLESLTRVRHTDITASICESLPGGGLYKTEEITVQVSSERLDAVIARVYHLSRENAAALFSKRLVFVQGKEISSISYTPRTGEIVSIRGFGRFVYRGYQSNSKKGKLNVLVEKYV